MFGDTQGNTAEGERNLLVSGREYPLHAELSGF